MAYVSLTTQQLTNIITAINNREKTSNKNKVSGYAGLDANKKLDKDQLPVATETDLGAIKIGSGLTIANGVVSADLSGVSGVSSFADLTDTPTTISGYGITDAVSTEVINNVVTSIMKPPAIDTKIIATTPLQLSEAIDGAKVKFNDLTQFDMYRDGVKLSNTLKQQYGTTYANAARFANSTVVMGVNTMITKAKFESYEIQDMLLGCVSIANGGSMSFVVGAYEDISGVLHTLTIRRKPNLMDLVYDEGTIREEVLVHRQNVPDYISDSQFSSYKTNLRVTKDKAKLTVDTSAMAETTPGAFVGGAVIIDVDLGTLGAKAAAFIEACSIGVSTVQKVAPSVGGGVAVFMTQLVSTKAIYNAVTDEKMIYDANSDSWVVDTETTLGEDLIPGSLVYNPITGSVSMVNETGGYAPGITASEVNTLIETGLVSASQPADSIIATLI